MIDPRMIDMKSLPLVLWSVDDDFGAFRVVMVNEGGRATLVVEKRGLDTLGVPSWASMTDGVGEYISRALMVIAVSGPENTPRLAPLSWLVRLDVLGSPEFYTLDSLPASGRITGHKVVQGSYILELMTYDEPRPYDEKSTFDVDGEITVTNPEPEEAEEEDGPDMRDGWFAGREAGTADWFLTEEMRLGPVAPDDYDPIERARWLAGYAEGLKTGIPF